MSFCKADDNKKQLRRKIYFCLWLAYVMFLLVRRQTFCRQERKIIKAHYMLAYECGLRRLRSGRVAHKLSDYNRHIAYDQCLSGFIYHCYHPPSFLIT